MAAPATLVVFSILRATDGTPIVGATVHCTLSINYATVTSTGDGIDEIQQSTVTDPTGRYAFTIVGNDLLSPLNTVYTIQEPHRSYQIAPQSGNGASQQTTAANVIVNVPTALAATTSNITGNLAIAGTLGVTGLLSANGGLAVTGAFSIPAGGFSMAGPLTLTAATSQIIPGATSFSVRDTGNANDNLLVSNAGVVTARAGFTLTAGVLTLPAASVADAALSANVPLKNAANTFSALQTISSGGLAVTGGITAATGGVTATAGDLKATAGNLVFGAVSAQIVPGATSLLVRNNANNATNLGITDAGIITLRSDLVLTANGRPTFTGSVPSVGSGGAGISALAMVAGSVNADGGVTAAFTGVGGGATVGIVAFNGAPLSAAPNTVLCSLGNSVSAATAPVFTATSYTTSGFTIKCVNSPSNGTYVINYWAIW